MNAYTKFLNLLQGISELDKFPIMTPLSKLILDQIALSEDLGQPLTVREMIDFDKLASPATLHKHLLILRNAGYVSASTDAKDKRTKYLVLTPLGHQYIHTLSKAVVRAAAS